MSCHLKLLDPRILCTEVRPPPSHLHRPARPPWRREGGAGEKPTTLKAYPLKSGEGERHLFLPEVPLIKIYTVYHQQGHPCPRTSRVEPLSKTHPHKFNSSDRYVNIYIILAGDNKLAA
jgi:hypothetical protein